MGLSDGGMQDTAGFLASLTHLVVVPRQGGSRTEMQRPARRRLEEADVRLVAKMDLRASDESGTGRWNRAPELVVVSLYHQRALGGSRLEDAARPRRKR